MRIHFLFRLLRISVLLTIFAAAIAIPLAKLWIHLDTKQSVYTETQMIPPQSVGLVLGCGRNIYFYHRIEATVRLYKAGKINHILVSGDNHKVTYNEAGAMKSALIKRGIPPDRITCDYAGFSTIDSIIRAKKVFRQNQITIISQAFHVRRALFIAKRHHIEAIGYCADDVETALGARTQMRESLARVKTILDIYFLHRKPRFLGEPVQIGISQHPPIPISRDKA